MDRYPRRPRAPFTGLTFGDYIWWGFLIFFRLWLVCQTITGIGALIYWWLPRDVSEFFFRDYITLWTVYIAPLFPEELWLMPMWYETSAWPIIGLILTLRVVELLRRVPQFQSAFPWAFGAFIRKPEASRYSRFDGKGDRKHEGYAYDPDRFAAGKGRPKPQERPRPSPLQLENKLEAQPRKHDDEDRVRTEPKDRQTEKAERLLRDPQTPRHVREATQRLLDRRKKNTRDLTCRIK